jgi:hypothetical protein
VRFLFLDLSISSSVVLCSFVPLVYIVTLVLVCLEASQMKSLRHLFGITKLDKEFLKIIVFFAIFRQPKSYYFVILHEINKTLKFTTIMMIMVLIKI